MIYLILFIAMFGLALIAVLLSFTTWVQQNMKWLTGYPFYAATGLLLGASLAMLAIHIAKHIGIDAPVP